jgi:hypothetical protein
MKATAELWAAISCELGGLLAELDDERACSQRWCALQEAERARRDSDRVLEPLARRIIRGLARLEALERKLDGLSGWTVGGGRG